MRTLLKKKRLSHRLKYLSVSHIAQLAWCQQKAKFLSEEKNDHMEDIYSGKYEQYYPYINDFKTVIEKKLFKKMGFIAFLKACDCSIMPYDYFLSNKKIQPNFGRKFDEITLVDSFYKLPIRIIREMKIKYEDKYEEWKEGLLKQLDVGFFVPNFWSDLPWDDNYKWPEWSFIKDDDHCSMGVYLEYKHAKKYSTQEKSFKWKNLRIQAKPDGVTKKFCYEFKSIKTAYYLRYSIPVALVQANLYSYLFKRPYFKVSFFIKDTATIKNTLRKTDKESACNLLETMDGLLKNAVRPIPPKRFKCLTCEFNGKCRVKKEAY